MNPIGREGEQDMTEDRDALESSTASADGTPSRRELIASLASLGLGAAVLAASAGGQERRVLSAPTVPQGSLPPETTGFDLPDIQRYLDGRLPDTNQRSILGELGRPVDLGADQLLQRYVLARLSHAPNQLEYLLQTLADHVRQCVEIRRQAQELEEKATATSLTLELERRLLDLNGEQLKLFGGRGDRVLSHTIDARFDATAGAIVSAESGVQLAGEIAKLGSSFVQAHRNSVENRATYFRQAGSGANLLQRHQFLKDLFDLELAEAYQRARAVVAGLWSLHRIDLPVPPLTPVGYLDALALWTRRAYYEYERRVLGRDVVTVYLPLRQIGELSDVGLMTEDDWKAGRQAGRFRFTLSVERMEKVAPGLKEPLLAGLALGVDGTGKTDPNILAPVMARASLQRAVFRDKAGVELAAIDPSAYIPTFPVAELTMAAVSQPRSFRNISPLGVWDIDLAKAKVSGMALRSASGDAALVNMILVLAISHEVA